MRGPIRANGRVVRPGFGSGRRLIGINSFIKLALTLYAIGLNVGKDSDLKVKQLIKILLNFRNFFALKIIEFFFQSLGSLKQHIMSHKGEKPFKCDGCDSRFVDRRQLNKHFKRKHTK